MANQITADNLRILARVAGLALPDEELQRVLPGVDRAKKQANELRELLAVDDEPASVFDLTRTTQK